MTKFNTFFLPQAFSSAVGKFKFALSEEQSHAGTGHFNLDSHIIHINLTKKSKAAIC